MMRSRVCDDDKRGPPPKQLRQAAYATQQADAAGPDAQMITMPPGVYIIQYHQGCLLYNASRGVYSGSINESIMRLTHR